MQLCVKWSETNCLFSFEKVNELKKILGVSFFVLKNSKKKKWNTISFFELLLYIFKVCVELSGWTNDTKHEGFYIFRLLLFLIVPSEKKCDMNSTSRKMTRWKIGILFINCHQTIGNQNNSHSIKFGRKKNAQFQKWAVEKSAKMFRHDFFLFVQQMREKIIQAKISNTHTHNRKYFFFPFYVSFFK